MSIKRPESEDFKPSAIIRYQSPTKQTVPSVQLVQFLILLSIKLNFSIIKLFQSLAHRHDHCQSRPLHGSHGHSDCYHIDQ